MTRSKQLAVAQRVKLELHERYGQAAWFRGIGLAPRGSGFAVRLNVAPESKGQMADVPSEVQGVPIEVVVMGTYSPRDD
jgi:hypothetical protein